MWTPGIKIGPDQDWMSRLQRSKATHVEVWYRVDWASRYTDMFEYCKKNDIKVGLHFWGMLPGGIMPNLAYPEKNIAEDTLKLMQTCIEVASQYNHTYVNIHVGNYSLQRLDLDKLTMGSVSDSKIAVETAEQVCTENAIKLNEYAKQRNIILTVETVPAENPARINQGKCLDTIPANALTPEYLLKMATQTGIQIANDISHTVCHAPVRTRSAMWAYLYDISSKLVPYTFLVHSNTMSEPFIGTDTHDGITDQDFANNVFPTKTQFAEFLALYENGKEVWVVNEPNTEHEANFAALQAFQLKKTQ